MPKLRVTLFIVVVVFAAHRGGTKSIDCDQRKKQRRPVCSDGDVDDDPTSVAAAGDPSLSFHAVLTAQQTAIFDTEFTT